MSVQTRKNSEFNDRPHGNSCPARFFLIDKEEIGEEKDVGLPSFPFFGLG